MRTTWIWAVKRFYWNTGDPAKIGVTASMYGNYSNKLSISFMMDLRSWYIGLSWDNTTNAYQTYVFIMFLCFGLRIHRVKNYGGRYK